MKFKSIEKYEYDDKYVEHVDALLSKNILDDVLMRECWFKLIISIHPTEKEMMSEASNLFMSNHFDPRKNPNPDDDSYFQKEFNKWYNSKKEYHDQLFRHRVYTQALLRFMHRKQWEDVCMLNKFASCIFGNDMEIMFNLGEAVSFIYAATPSNMKHLIPDSVKSYDDIYECLSTFLNDPGEGFHYLNMLCDILHAVPIDNVTNMTYPKNRMKYIREHANTKSVEKRHLIFTDILYTNIDMQTMMRDVSHSDINIDGTCYMVLATSEYDGLRELCDIVQLPYTETTGFHTVYDGDETWYYTSIYIKSYNKTHCNLLNILIAMSYRNILK